MFKSRCLIKKLLGLFSMAFLLLSFSSAYLHTQKMGTMDMPMPGCPMMMNTGTTMLCTMSPLEHLQAWQHMFLAIPSIDTVFLLGLVLLSLLILYPYSPTSLLQLRRISLNVFFYDNRRLTHISYIAEAFSSGILNPKLY